MISADILIRDIDANGWANLVSLIDPNTVRRLAGEAERPPGRKKRLFVIFEENSVLKAYHTEKGSILDGFKWNGPQDLEIVSRREDVDAVVAVDRDSLSRIFARSQRNTDMRDDFVKQILGMYDSVAMEVGKGLYFHPERKLKRITYENIQKGFKLGTQDNTTILFYLFDGNQIWTSLIVGIKDGDVDMVTSHDALAARGVFVYDWKKDYKKILGASKQAFRKPSIGVFGDVRSFARVARSRKTLKALNEERKKKNIILDPLPLLFKTALRAGKFFI